MIELAQFFKSLNIVKVKEGRSIKFLKLVFDPQKSANKIVDKENVLCPFCKEVLHMIRTKEEVLFFWS